MDFMEKDLEEILFNADRNQLKKKGLFFNGVLKRQLHIGNYGKADLVAFDRGYELDENVTPMLRISIFELKKESVGISAFLQAIRYMKGIQSFFNKRYVNYDIKYNIILIGRKVDKKSDFIYLTDLIPDDDDGGRFLELYSYSYDIDGIKFKQEYGYSLTNDGL